MIYIYNYSNILYIIKLYTVQVAIHIIYIYIYNTNTTQQRNAITCLALQLGNKCSELFAIFIINIIMKFVYHASNLFSVPYIKVVYMQHYMQSSMQQY